MEQYLTNRALKAIRFTGTIPFQAVTIGVVINSFVLFVVTNNIVKFSEKLLFVGELGKFH